VSSETVAESFPATIIAFEYIVSIVDCCSIANEARGKRASKEIIKENLFSI
jgi:hypothetical protein